MGKIKNKTAEQRMLSRISSVIVGKPVQTVFLPEGDEALGYTHQGKPTRVYVGYEHPIMDGLTPEQKAALRLGVNVHEDLHQVYTNFDYTNKVVNERKSQAEAGVLMEVLNLLEDPAIEYRAPLVCGGDALAGLRFSKRWIYKQSQPITKARTPWSQLVSALIHFGDMGLVKGSFTFPEAEEAFAKVAPLFNKGIHEPNSRKRIDIGIECFELTRPLWEEEVKNAEAMEELLKKLAEALKKHGRPSPSKEKAGGAGEGEDGESEGKMTPEEKRRAETLKKLLKKMAAKKGSSSSKSEDGDESEGADSEGADSEGSSAEGSEEGEEGKTGSSAGKEESEDSEGASGSGEDGEEDDREEGEEGSKGKAEESSSKGTSESSSLMKTSAEKSSSEDSSSSSSSPSEPTPEAGEADGETESAKSSSKSDESSEDDGYTASEEEAESIVDDELEEISEEALDSIEKGIKKEEKAIEREERERAETFEMPNLEISSEALTGVRCLNKHVVSADPAKTAELYAELKAEYNWDIKLLTKSLNKIFEGDKEEDARTTSGKYNVLRGAVATSVRLFDKKKYPGGKKDAAVVLCVDESGSMRCEDRDTQARRSAIILAEALAALDVPCRVMGFTADQEGYGAVHLHYTDWKNRKTDRANLVSMKARSNNLDGYSIRYAANLLKERNEKNKILFVISDGAPAAYGYRGRGVGVADTTKAIHEASKIASTVFGIALGSDAPIEMLAAMYGKNFIAVTDPERLASTLAKRLEKIIKAS